jgi:hypothetical protein
MPSSRLVYEGANATFGYLRRTNLRLLEVSEDVRSLRKLV